MSIRAVVDRLAGAKRQLEQARTIGNQAAEGISVAKCALDDALDGVQDKSLSTDTAAQAKGSCSAGCGAAGGGAGLNR